MRALLRTFTVLFGVLAAEPALAQAQTIRLIVPFAAGGPADVIARQLAEKMGPMLGTAVVVENRTGANGGIAARQVATAEPDGTTLLFATSGMLTISQALYKSLPYDTLRDFTPVSRAVINGSALIVSKDKPPYDIRSLIAYGRTLNRPITLGSAGIGNITHLYVELLRDATKMNITHVPYKGIAPAMQDTIAGQIDGVFADFPLSLPQIRAGTVKSLGIVGDARNPSAPDLATIAEQGFPGVDGASWFGFMAPAKTPPAVVQRVADAIAKAMREDDLNKKLLAGGSAPAATTPYEMRALLEVEQKRWSEIVAARNITVNE